MTTAERARTTANLEKLADFSPELLTLVALAKMFIRAETERQNK